MIKKLTFILLAASCMQSMYSQNTEKLARLWMDSGKIM